MTVQIGPQAAMLLIVGCIVGVCVFKYAARNHAGAPSKGDLVGAIGAAVGVIMALALLIGVGAGGEGSAPGSAEPHGVATSPPLP